MGSDLNELQNFEQLIAALSAHFGIPLDGSDRTVIIVDEAEKIVLVAELATAPERIYLIRPLLDFPDAADLLARMTMDALLLNADRQALDEAVVCADAHRNCFCLIKTLGLPLAAADFIAAVDRQIDIADAARTYLLDEPGVPAPEVPPIRVQELLGQA